MPFIGFRASSTQAILNNIPQWMAMRQKTDSNGWQFVNSWGIALDQVNDLVSDKLKNLFCYTSDRTARFKIFRGTVINKDPFEYKESRNLLYNSSFAIKDAARTRLPMGWTDYTAFDSNNAILDNQSMIGAGSIKIVQDNYKIGQLRTINKKLTNVCGSIYLKSDDRVIGKLLISCESINGIITNYEKTIDATCTDWTRFYIANQLNSELYRYNFVFVLISGEVNICCPQLEDSLEPTAWQSNADDVPYFLGSGLPFKLVQVLSDHRKLILYPVTSTDDFAIIDIPTRAEQVTAPNDSMEATTNNTFGKLVGFFKDTTTLNWKASSNKIAVYDANNSNEVFKHFNIRDIRWFEESGYGTADTDALKISPKALTVNGNYLYVISNEQYKSNNGLILKIIKAKLPPNNADYLESINDIYLETDILPGTGEEVTSVASSETYSNILILTTNFNRKIYIKLYFDYYFINASNRNIYTLEDYENSVIQVI